MMNFRSLTLEFAGCKMDIPIPMEMSADESIRQMLKSQVIPVLNRNYRVLDESRVYIEVDTSSFDEYFKFFKEKDEDGNDCWSVEVILGAIQEEFLIIPNEHEGLPVRRVVRENFSGYPSIYFLYIPENIREIQNGVFSEMEMLSVHLGSNVRSIGSYAFSVNRIESINLPPSLQFLGSYALSNNKLEYVKIGKSIEFVGEFAFATNELHTIDLSNYSPRNLPLGCFFNNVKLREVILPEGLKSIGRMVFKNTLIRDVVIPKSVVSISKDSFEESEMSNERIMSILEEVSENASKGEEPV